MIRERHELGININRRFIAVQLREDEALGPSTFRWRWNKLSFSDDDDEDEREDARVECPLKAF